jgi:hypothetical protein
MVTPVNHNPSGVTHKLGTETTNVNYESGRINNGPTYELAATSKKKKSYANTRTDYVNSCNEMAR